jgi:DTW domain-containing protein
MRRHESARDRLLKWRRAIRAPFHSPMTDSTSLRRPQCARCLRPQRTCLCALASPVASRVELLILQHPLEVANAKGTARLLHLCLPGSVMVSGEAFDAAELATLLAAGARTPVLLFPETPDEKSLGIAPPPPFPAGQHAPSALRLVVLDGTWRKSRKMLYLNPALQALPRLALHDVPVSQYRIRKAHLPDQLSTLEAAALALEQLEGKPGHGAPLLGAFERFLAQYTQHAHA